MTPPAATAAGRTLARPIAPRKPRRVSGPAARPRRGNDGQRSRRAAAPAADPFIVRALHRTRALADSRFLDRLIRGRLWIPIVAAGLMGIVFMQVSMLKLNAGIGRAVQSAATLERQNANLRASVSGMESGSRIDAAARKLGMVVPADGSTHYVTAAARGLAATAASRMTAADPEAIARSKAVTAAMAAGQTLTAATTAGVATTQAAAPTAASTATTAAATTPTGTVAAAPTAATTATPTQGTTAQPTATQQPSGATAAPTSQVQTQQSQQTQTQSQQPPTQQAGTAAATATSTSGGAVAPPQG